MKQLFLSLIFCTFSLVNAFEPTIPVVHIPDYHDVEKREDFLEILEYTLKEVGFFAVTGLGVDVDVLDKAYAETELFFARDFEDKMGLQGKDGQRGYSPGESAKDETRIDLKEFYHIAKDTGHPDEVYKNIWPEDRAEFKDSMTKLYALLEECNDAIGKPINTVMKQEMDFHQKMVVEGFALMRTIHYPKNPPADEIWAGAHTDINYFTLLPRATAKGLQVFNKEGEWIDVVVPDGAFVVNCADMLENVTNGYFKSARHRVIDRGEGKDRYSIVMFAHPTSEKRVDPLPRFIELTGGVRKYANVSALELLAERLIDLGIASQDMMEFFVESGAIEKLKEVDRFSEKAEKALIEAGFVLN